MDQPIVHPGPFDYRVLVGQKEHRSQDVWDNGTHESPRCRRLDGEFWQHIKEHPIHERVLQYLCRAGFYGIYAAGHTSLDHAMITSLLERWRPETHTFHLRTGEATITLQDVSVLYGLPVDGLPITDIDDQLQTVDWQRIMQRLLGWAPLDRHFDGSSLKMGPLISYVTSLYPITSWTAESAVQQRVRLYLLWMIGGILAADTSCRVKLMFLKLLDDLDRVGDYAWGAASLAILYRYLCQGSQQGSSVIAGFLPLLQVWIYERILPFRPRRELQLDGPSLVIAGFPRPPRASIWSVALHHDTEAAHLLYLFRDQLDLLTDDQDPLPASLKDTSDRPRPF